MKMELKVYVWKRFCRVSYGSGFAIAIAYTQEGAMAKVREAYSWTIDDDEFGPVEVYPLQEMAFAVSGGS